MKKILPLLFVVAIMIGVYARSNHQNPSYLTVSVKRMDDGGSSQKLIASSDNQIQEASRSAIPSGDTGAGEVMGEMAVDPNIGSLLDYIHLAESSRGKNTNPYALHNVCKSKGQSNEYGYGGMRLMKCFDSHEQASAHVADWLKRHLNRFDGDVAKTLCYYNLGLEEINCKYYQGYLGIDL